MKLLNIPRLFNMEVVCIAVFAMSPIDSVADDVVFPNADGSWKILSADAWGGTVPTTDRPKFSATNPTYIVDRDGWLSGMSIDYKARWGNNCYTFSSRMGRNLLLADKYPESASGRIPLPVGVQSYSRMERLTLAAITC